MPAGLEAESKTCVVPVDSFLVAFLSPLRGFLIFSQLSHGLRRGLYSLAASRLDIGRFASTVFLADLVLTHCGLRFVSYRC